MIRISFLKPAALWCLSVLFLPFSTMLAQTTTVFQSGTEGYKSFRIPAIIALPGGELLAFCEGRTGSAADFGNIDIVMKRSHDRGKTWSALNVIVDAGALQAGNPAPVVDQLDPQYPQGRIFLFYNTGNNQEAQVAKGNGLRECWYICSVDGGEHWSAPVNITTQVHKPKQASINAAYNFAEDWRTYANTPGHALQIPEGPYKGRIFIAANHSAGEPQNNAGHYSAHGYYSDDHGKTFRLSATLSLPGSNEATAAFTSDGGILLNARNQSGQPRCRIAARSKDGGATWDSIYYDHALPDPVCEGSLLNPGIKKRKKRIAFCNAADTAARNHLTLRISDDDGISWKKNILIDGKTGAANEDYTAYSDLVKISKKQIGVLYEKENYSRIVFKRVKW